MSQWLVDIFRRRTNDRVKAMRALEEARSRQFRALAGDHDAFVGTAETSHDGIPLGTAQAADGREVRIRIADEYAHWWVQGGTGSGKTSWVSSILCHEIVRGRPCGVVDLKGDLFHSMIRRTAAMGHILTPERREALNKRVVVLNPFASNLMPLNVCRVLPGFSPETQAYEIALALSRLFESSLGVHMENILRHLLMLLMEANLTLLEAPIVLQDEVLRGVLASRSANPSVKQFFLATYAAIPQVSKDAISNRIQGLLLAENLRLMLGADDLVDFKAIFDRGEHLFVFLGKGPGVPEEQVEVLGSLIFQLLVQATYARGSGTHGRYLLAMDEFFHLLEVPGLARRFETALTTSRSFGLSLLLISHNFAQLPPALREIALGNCDLIGLFRTSGRNASFFGDFLPEVDLELLARAYTQGKKSALSPYEIRRHQMELLQRLPSRNCFWYDRRKPHRAVRIRVPDVRAAHEIARISEPELERIIREEGWDRGAAALPKADLNAQIAARQRRIHELLHPPIMVRSADQEKIKPPANSRSRPNLGSTRT